MPIQHSNMIRDLENGTITLQSREEATNEMNRCGVQTIRDLDNHLWYDCGIVLILTGGAKEMLYEEVGDE